MIITDIAKIEKMKTDPERYVYRGLTHDEYGDYYAIIDDRVRQATDHIIESQWADDDEL